MIITLGRKRPACGPGKIILLYILEKKYLIPYICIKKFKVILVSLVQFQPITLDNKKYIYVVVAQ